MYGFVAVNGSRCNILGNVNFARCILNMEVEAVLFENNGQRSLEMFITVEYIRNEREYVDLQSRRKSVSSKQNVLSLVVIIIVFE